jgi:hypothetical protein
MWSESAYALTRVKTMGFAQSEFKLDLGWQTPEYVGFAKMFQKRGTL